MLTLKKYRQIARSILKRHAPYLVDDEEALGTITTVVATADTRFNGEGTLEGYRTYCAQNAVKNILRARARDKDVHSLDYEYATSDGEGKRTLASQVECRHSTPEQVAECKDFLEAIERAEWLTESQKECVISYFRDNMTYNEIATKRGTSKAAVHGIVKKALKKIRGNMSV